MNKSEVHWKWNANLEEMYYSKHEIVKLINPKKQLGRQEIYCVDDHEAYNIS